MRLVWLRLISDFLLKPYTESAVQLSRESLDFAALHVPIRFSKISCVYVIIFTFCPHSSFPSWYYFELYPPAIVLVSADYSHFWYKLIELFIAFGLQMLNIQLLSMALFLQGWQSSNILISTSILHTSTYWSEPMFYIFLASSLTKL
jgi:hypothetical protein